MPADPGERIEGVWGQSLTLPLPTDASLRLASVPDGTHAGSYSTAHTIHPTVRRVRSDTDAGIGIDYRLGDPIGRGGMGVVHSAWQESVGRRVALKLVRDELRDDPLAESRFRSEAALTGALEHPGIVPVYDLGINEAGRSFFAMKLVSGKPWSGAIRAMSVADNLAVLLRVAEAVAFAHHHGIIHADLKPGNVMLGDFGEVLLLDWGLALRMEDGKAYPLASGAPVGGTSAYMAPEQAVQDLSTIGPATDIYLLGAILYEIASGKRPHAGPDLRSCLAAAARNQLVPAEGDPELLAIARHAMATSPADRHADVAAFAADLRAWRIHADSTALLERSRALVAGTDLAACADALRAIEESRALWPGNPHADAAEGHVRQAWARRALDAGDAGLAATVARPGLDGEASLHTEACRLAQRQASELRRLRWLRAGLVLLVFGILAGAWLGYREVTRAEIRAQAALAAAETARNQAEESAYRARLAQALATANAGDRDGALALLDRCPAPLRGCEWQVLRTRAEESVRQLPGFPFGSHVVAWADAGTQLWVGGEGFVSLLRLPEARIERRIGIPSVAQALAASSHGLLVGLHQGCIFLPADGSAPIAAPLQDPVTRVAQSAAGACLFISKGSAWRWSPGGDPVQEWPEAVAVDWLGERPVVATASQVLIGGQLQFEAADGDIQVLHWRQDLQAVLLRRGPRIRNDGTEDPLPANTPPEVPRKPTYELRRRDGSVVCRADQFYLDRDPAIAADGMGFTVVHARYHTVVRYGCGSPDHRAVFSEPVNKCDSASDGTVAVAWAGGVGLLARTQIRHTLLQTHRDVPLAMAFQGTTLGMVSCGGSLTLLRPGQEPQTIGGGSHVDHQASPFLLAPWPDGGFFATIAWKPQLVGIDGTLRPFAAGFAGKAPQRAIPSPDGKRVLWYADGRLRVCGASPGPADSHDLPIGWLDATHALVAENQDLVLREADAWTEIWRVAQGAATRQWVCILRLGSQLLVSHGTGIDIRSVTDGSLLGNLDRHRGHVTALAATSDRLISADSTGHLVFWKLPGYQLVLACPWSQMPITALAAAPGLLAVGTEERLAHVWGQP